MFRLSFLLGAVCLAGSLSAQYPIAGPVEGVVFDKPARSFRAVLGALGSASLGSVVAGTYDFGSVAPLHQHGLGWSDGRLNLVSGLTSDHPSAVKIEAGEAIPEPERAAWSTDGSVAVLYSRTGNWILPVTGLPGSPSLGALIDVSATGKLLTAVAIDGKGDNVVVATTGESPGMYKLRDGLQLIQLAALGNPVALSFSPDGQLLYAIDAAEMRVAELRIHGSGLEFWPIASIQEPVGIRVAKGGSGQAFIHIIGASDRRLVTYDVRERQAISQLELSFVPTSIDQLGRDSFLLRAREHEGDPLWSFTTSSTPLVRFIPATPLAVGEETGQ
jgi:hypothetical protein